MHADMHMHFDILHKLCNLIMLASGGASDPLITRISFTATTAYVVNRPHGSRAPFGIADWAAGHPLQVHSDCDGQTHDPYNDCTHWRSSGSACALQIVAACARSSLTCYAN